MERIVDSGYYIFMSEEIKLVCNLTYKLYDWHLIIISTLVG